jgi:hypothetical protein
LAHSPAARRASSLACKGKYAYIAGMNRFFNIADHDRLPWRFYGATRAILARR